ncbi:hypothetical protein SAY87_013728 [Trapa incisa]|uniref:Exostosin GT47 domain-containing protein n=1 Tax=Trapa incisa TaxID=236973 RepID=A0AAN7KJX5_9MYRT|nr:hypothetical protein SAY87_013728 [Trapa incisa]
MKGSTKAILLSLAFGFVLLITYAIFIGSVDVRSRFFPLLQNPLQTLTSSCTDRPLRVYMYNIPSRFHVGMLNQGNTNDSSPVTAQNLPPWPQNSGLKLQHSMEYWMMASLLYDGEGQDMEALRVSDPESADVFFVPFFSSLSFNTHGHNMKDPETEIDHKLQIDLLQFLGKSIYWQRSGGRDHVICMTHPNAFRFLGEQVNASIFIVVDFGRHPKTVSNLYKDVVSPYVHVVDSFVDDANPDPFESRPILLFFRGGTIRKDEGIVRAKLAKILSGYDDVHYEQSVASTENIELSKQGMRLSKFCLHPAGDTPSSCRLFDAIVSHCVPVIVSDRIELPFEDELDYTQFSLFFSVQEALRPNYMVEQLQGFKKERWTEMWQKLKNVSLHFEFQFPPRKEDGVNMLWRQVKHKIPVVTLATHRSRRLKIPDRWRRGRH